jgi:C4-dicarboxylate transporter DctM subunit
VFLMIVLAWWLHRADAGRRAHRRRAGAGRAVASRWPMPTPNGGACWPCRRTCTPAWASTRCWRCRCSCWSARSSTAPGVAQRMVDFAMACVGRSRHAAAGGHLVAMVLGGISGSGPANAAAVGGVMIAAMARAGYPAAFSASVVGAAAATDILIPPSIAFIVYSVLVPGASVPALFAAGMIPGVLAGLALIVPAVWLSRRHGMGRPSAACRAAVLALAARGDLGPGRAGADPRRHARRLVHAHRGRRGGRVLRPVRRHGRAPHDRRARPVRHLARRDRTVGGDHAWCSLAGIFAYSVSTLGIADPVTRAIVNSGLGSQGAR